MTAMTIHFRGILYRCRDCGLRSTDPSKLCEPEKITPSSDHHYSTTKAVECYTQKLVEPRFIVQA